MKPEFGRSLDAVLARVGPLISTALLAAVIAVGSIIAAPFLALYWLGNREATIDGERNWGWRPCRSH